MTGQLLHRIVAANVITLMSNSPEILKHSVQENRSRSRYQLIRKLGRI